MTSTPPPAAGSPEQIAWMNWMREQVEGVRVDATIAREGVGAAIQQSSTASNVAANLTVSDAATQERLLGPDSNNRIARPILDGEYWTAVTDQSRYVWEYPSVATPGAVERSTARNATWNYSGAFILQPNADIEGAEIDITPILPTPTSGKIYVEAEYLGSTVLRPEIWIFWRDSAGDALLTENPPTVVSGKAVVDVPAGFGSQVPKYSVRLVRAAGAGVGAAIDPKVFEVVGTGGMAISPVGVSVEDGSGNTTIEINPTLPILDAPTAPILTTGAASVSVRWDGSLTSGPAPAHLSYVYAEEGTSATGPWTRVGQPLNRTGDIITRPPVGATRWYRFTAMDTSNRPSAASAVNSVTVAGVDIPDLSGDIGDILDTVDGLNKIFYQTIDNPPPAVDPVTGRALVNADLWFIVDGDTSIVREVRIWNGTLWNPYRIVADSVIVPGSVGTITLADGAITSPKIKAREIEGDRMKIGTLSTNELTPNIGSSLDITINPAVTDLQNDLEVQRRYYRFDDEGLKIGDPETNEELRLNPGRIEMVQAGNVPTWWEAQTFYVERMVVDAANIGEHRWEKYATGRSVIRPL